MTRPSSKTVTAWPPIRLARPRPARSRPAGPRLHWIRAAVLALPLAAAGLLPLAAPAATQPSAPKAERAVQRLADRALAILGDPSLDTDARAAALTTLLRDSLDVRTIADFVLGRHDRGLSETEEAEFRAVFAEHLVDSTARVLARQSIAGIEVMDSRKVTERTAAVSTQVRRGPDRRATWTWRLHRRASGYRVVDLQANGVSLAVSYRAEIGGDLTKQGLDQVLRGLRERTRRSDPIGFERMALWR